MDALTSSLSVPLTSRATPSSDNAPGAAAPKAVKAARATPTTAPQEKHRRSPGRSRSDASRTAILRSTLKLLESSTLQEVSIEAIAQEAGVGKATIYRWWSSKASVVIDAFIQYHVSHTPMPRDIPAREALNLHLHSLIDEYRGRSGRLVAQILAEGQSNPAVLQEFRERFFYGRQAVVREVMERARRSGEFRTDLDIEAAMDMLYSPIYFRLFLGHLPLDRQFADAHAATTLGLLSTSEEQPRQANTGRPSPKGTKAVRKRQLT